MWYDEFLDGDSWSKLWFGYIVCGDCGGIRTIAESCPSCAALPFQFDEPLATRDDGTRVSNRVFMGAEGRYEDYVYLRLIEREWKRNISEDDRDFYEWNVGQSSPKAVIALVFWTYFETRIERLLRQSMRNIPNRVNNDLLARYSSIGLRLDRLYRLLFESTYWSDLESLGFGSVARLLKDLQECRNRFIHGEPAAIDDGLIEMLVASLKLEHESWIAVFNVRATRRNG